jgi:hypothetical protein
MPNTTFFTTERKNENPVLIIDQDGTIGEKLVYKIQEELTIVLVSKKSPKEVKNLIHIPFSKHLPKIPDNTYSAIIIIDEDLELNYISLKTLISKAKKDKTIVFFGINYYSITDKFFVSTISPNDNVKLGILGDIFTNDSILHDNNQINKYLTSIKNTGKINIPGDGTSETFPVFLDDVVGAIIEICFSGAKEKTFYMLPKNIITNLSLATDFKKVFPEIKLDFTKESAPTKNNKLALQGKYVFGEKYNLIEKIKTINIEKIEGFEKQKINNSKTTKNSLFLTLLFFIVLLILPAISTLLFSATGEYFVKQAQINLVNGNNQNAEILSQVSLSSFFLSNINSNIFRQEVGSLGNFGETFGINKNNLSNYNLSRVYYNYSVFLNKLSSVVVGKSSAPSKDFAIATNALDTSNLILVQNLNVDFFSNAWKNNTNVFEFTAATVNFWPEILGFNGKRNYLVLLEDNQQSVLNSRIMNYYTVLKADNGKISKVTLNTDLPKYSSISAILSSAKSKVTINGIVVIDKNFTKEILRIINNSKNNNLINNNTISLFINGLKEKQIIIFLENPIAQAALNLSGY